MQQKIIIAIDGLSSSGKSTMAKRLAGFLSYRYIDSGAFYRAVTLYFHEHAIDWKDHDSLQKALLDIDLSFYYDLAKNESKTILNGKSVDHEIRGIFISNLVSEISALPEVRKFVVARLQQYADGEGIVMDGRDIGTVVFPAAELKIYLTASEKVRGERRFNEMKTKGIEVTESQVINNLTGRDQMDSTRKTGPLKKADDAYVIDNSSMSEEEQFELVLKLAQEKIAAN